MLHLSGPRSFIKAAEKLYRMLEVDRYAERWPLIPRAELEASCVKVVDAEGGLRCISALPSNPEVDPDCESWRAMVQGSVTVCLLSTA